MTKPEVIKKIKALRKLAEGTPYPEEVKAAKRLIEKLCKKHSVTEADLAEGPSVTVIDLNKTVLEVLFGIYRS